MPIQHSTEITLTKSAQPKNGVIKSNNASNTRIKRRSSSESIHAASRESKAQKLIHDRVDPFIDITRLRIPSTPLGCLSPGASFKGVQRSGWQSYTVTVDIQDVSITNSQASGYLCIDGLTRNQPSITTFFTAEIIGNKYGFRTNKYDATASDDLKHWSKFDAFKRITKKDDNRMTYDLLKDFTHTRAIFMRWKEHFCVPDSSIKDIPGASFDGFYYVCIDLDCPPSDITHPSIPSSGPHLSGYYFHPNSEPFQQLNLRELPKTTSDTFEFR
ncbi:hypothetical protein E3P99_01555 [Wallemia hederae]|uniref:Uncharacterized protein n=1 Tax=Wallemia hederae TaxID=1540922 RepID=A0A4T0FR84_9BASI|nr:hypothetical protein E3P99_01555 [Wallemia hederae]